jgi:hypothetical protein
MAENDWIFSPIPESSRRYTEIADQPAIPQTRFCPASAVQHRLDSHHDFCMNQLPQQASPGKGEAIKGTRNKKSRSMTGLKFRCLVRFTY